MVCERGKCFGCEMMAHERKCAVKASKRPCFGGGTFGWRGVSSERGVARTEEDGVVYEALASVGHWLERDWKDGWGVRMGCDGGGGTEVVLDMHSVGGTGRRWERSSFGGFNWAGDTLSVCEGGPGGTSRAHSEMPTSPLPIHLLLSETGTDPPWRE